MENIHVVRIESFGGPEVLQFDDLPGPQPSNDEVLIRVCAASVNPVDFKIREGKYPAVKSDRLPYALGRDVSGVVAIAGPKAKWRKGDAVFAMLGIDRGGYADQVIVKGNEAAGKPKLLDHVAAAAVPLAGLTAWQGLFRHGGLHAGQSVLIHGGSGGVGHLAIQLAKAKGARVITTVSEHHIPFVKEIGADQVIDYKKERFEDVISEVDMVFDLIGGETQERSWPVMKKGGILVPTLQAPSQEKAQEFGVRGTRFTVEENAEELAQIAALIDAEKVKPRVSRTYPLEDAAEAQEYVKKGHTEGKIVLKVAA